MFTCILLSVSIVSTCGTILTGCPSHVLQLSSSSCSLSMYLVISKKGSPATSSESFEQSFPAAAFSNCKIIHFSPARWPGTKICKFSSPGICTWRKNKPIQFKLLKLQCAPMFHPKKWESWKSVYDCCHASFYHPTTQLLQRSSPSLHHLGQSYLGHLHSAHTESKQGILALTREQRKRECTPTLLKQMGHLLPSHAEMVS